MLYPLHLHCEFSSLQKKKVKSWKWFESGKNANINAVTLAFRNYSAFQSFPHH